MFPGRLSFLLAMRYYAGNWAASAWLFRGESHRKLERLTKSAPWVHDQLDRFYDRATAIGLVGRVMAFRLMHLHGRCLPRLIPRAVPRLEDDQYADGEVIAGLVLGWNFGDGHLHSEQLLEAVQAQCGFEPGELRCIFLVSQSRSATTAWSTASATRPRASSSTASWRSRRSAGGSSGVLVASVHDRHTRALRTRNCAALLHCRGAARAAHRTRFGPPPLLSRALVRVVVTKRVCAHSTTNQFGCIEGLAGSRSS
jgi:hypothetical protein